MFLLFLNNFSSFPFEMNLLKSTTRDNLKSTFSLLFFFFFRKETRKYILTKGPTFAGLARPFLTQTAELQDGEGHPRASVGGGVSSLCPVLCSPPLTVPLKCISPECREQSRLAYGKKPER